MSVFGERRAGRTVSPCRRRLQCLWYKLSLRKSISNKGTLTHNLITTVSQVGQTCVLVPGKISLSKANALKPAMMAEHDVMRKIGHVAADTQAASADLMTSRLSERRRVA